MIQSDYFQFELTEVEQLNTKYLKPHPTIKNRYKLSLPEGKFKGRAYYGDYIDIYHCNQRLNIKSSLPYLRYGHNLISFGRSEIKETLEDLSEILEKDLFKAKVKNHEYAILQKSKLPFKYLKRLIGGVQGMELLKKTPHLLMFGNSTLKCKIYSVAPNLRGKMNSSLAEKFPWGAAEDIVKVELHFNRSQSDCLLDYLTTEIDQDRAILSEFLQDKITVCPIGTNGNTFSDILFMALVNIGWNHCSYEVVFSEIQKQINLADLTSSQKSARRKSLENKVSEMKILDHNSLMDFLEPPEDINYISRTFPIDNCLISKS